MDCVKNSYLKFELNALFKKMPILTISKIKNYLDKMGFDYEDEELAYLINELLIDRGILVRKDYWRKECEYVKIREDLENSHFTRHFYSFEVDDFETKKFLLIADTHIGDDNMEDFKLINNIYDYAINNGLNKCFHLGDLFAVKCTNHFFETEEKNSQIQRFIANYPKTLPNEMITYALKGNHDKQIGSEFCLNNISDLYCDLRQLNYFNPSFYVFPVERWVTSFSDKEFHFSHRFYHSALMKNLKVKTPQDLINESKWLDSNYDVQISGHLHGGLIYRAGISEYTDKEKMFLGVPSTSKLNINGTVGFLVTLNYSQENKLINMNVTCLNCDNNYKIGETETVDWNFDRHNAYQKVKFL